MRSKSIFGEGREGIKCSSPVGIDSDARLFFQSSFGRIMLYKLCFMTVQSFFVVYFPGNTSSGAHSSDVASRSSLSKDFHKLESSQESAKTRPLLQRQHVF